VTIIFFDTINFIVVLGGDTSGKEKQFGIHVLTTDKRKHKTIKAASSAVSLLLYLKFIILGLVLFSLKDIAGLTTRETQEPLTSVLA